MRAEYVVPLNAKMSARLEMLEGDQGKTSSAAVRAKIAKQIETLRKKQTELLGFEEKLRNYSDMRISISLDDGVKANYGRFGDLLSETKAVVGASDDK